jgi:hypothetical protein
MDPRLYDIGAPTLTEVWVNPATGNDMATGNSRPEALRTITEAWGRITSETPLTTTGYRILLVGGNYPAGVMPNYWEFRYGTFQCPIIIEAADGAGTAHLAPVNMYACRYIYFINLDFEAEFDLLHFELCDHILLRNVYAAGLGNVFAGEGPQETLKANQTQFLYVENCDISGATDNAVDCVAVQYGHFVGNRIHRAADWCMYLKGGSAYFRVEGNEFYDGGTGGFTAGQGTGFEFMTPPWLHYEAYDIKFISNIIHDTAGAGIGVQGGYNVLMAYNTMYRVGERSHVIEVGFGLRGCDGETSECGAHLGAGGWGTTERNDGSNEQPIPNHNVFIYNNIVYNPPGYWSAWQHFHIPGPRTPGAGSNIPSPAVADHNLQIRGNIIWNGPTDHPLGIEGEDGCQAGNPTCTAEQLRTDNAINTVEPELVNPGSGDFRPVSDGNVFSVLTYAIPDFTGGDRPAPPTPPEGNLINIVPRDFDGVTRSNTWPAGAFVAPGTGPVTYSAGGRATDPAGAGIADVLVSFAVVAGGGSVPSAVRTTSSGDWQASGFRDGTTYRATPSLAGFSFTPSSQEFSAARTDLNFTATAAGYEVSGRIKRKGGGFLPGTVLTFEAVTGTGSIPAPVIAGEDGRWSQSGFQAGTTYRVTPSLSGFTFKPASREFVEAARKLNFKGKPA